MSLSVSPASERAESPASSTCVLVLRVARLVILSILLVIFVVVIVAFDHEADQVAAHEAGDQLPLRIEARDALGRTEVALDAHRVLNLHLLAVEQIDLHHRRVLLSRYR